MIKNGMVFKENIKMEKYVTVEDIKYIIMK